jgi:2-hydroxycyclohexanecarboxyl-CoA dehydrogenase
MSSTSKVAVVTGAGRGIGLRIAERLAGDGLSVSLWDLNGEAARTAAEDLSRRGYDVDWAEIDVSNTVQVQAARQALLSRWERLDVLVNCAGWDRYGWFLESTEDYWDRVIATNYIGVLAMCRYLGSDVAEQHGRIVNISSNTAKLGYALVAVYAGAKAAVIAFSRALAREMASSGTTVNVICPGATDTPLLREDEQYLDSSPKFGPFFAQGFLKTVLEGIPLGRLGSPDDIAGAVSFLVGPDAGYITGQVLSVDGGQTMY